MNLKLPWLNIKIYYEDLNYKLVYLMIDDYVAAFKQDCEELDIEIDKRDLDTLESLLHNISRISYQKINRADNLNCGGYVNAIINIARSYNKQIDTSKLVNQNKLSMELIEA